MVPRFKYHFLPIIFILFSCVENRIFIQIHPDGQSYFKFESHGDSTDELDETIKWLKPHIMVIGSDWKNKKVIGKKWAEKNTLRSELFNSNKSLKKAIILKEVLDKPLALRK